MNCGAWEERIALYLGGELPAGQMAEVAEHIGECAGCQLFASGMKEALEVLRGAHGDVPAEAHFAAVRARVMADVERTQFGAWRRALAWGLVAAGVLIVAGAVRLYRPVPAPPVLALAPPVAPVSAYRSPARRAAAPVSHASVRRPAPAPTPALPETVTIKLLTDDPDVVIYWIADRKGE